MEETIHFYPKGTCSTEMFVTHDNGVITAVRIIRGCPGNTQGLSRLLVGMTLDDVIERLDGIKCRNGTSCPDQLVKGIKDHLKK